MRRNAEASGPLLEIVVQPDAAGASFLRNVADAICLTARGYHRLLKAARTLADHDGADNVGRRHPAEAEAYRAAPDRPRAVA